MRSLACAPVVAPSRDDIASMSGETIPSLARCTRSGEAISEMHWARLGDGWHDDSGSNASSSSEPVHGESVSAQLGPEEGDRESSEAAASRSSVSLSLAACATSSACATCAACAACDRIPARSFGSGGAPSARLETFSDGFCLASSSTCCMSCCMAAVRLGCCRSAMPRSVIRSLCIPNGSSLRSESPLCAAMSCMRRASNEWSGAFTGSNGRSASRLAGTSPARTAFLCSRSRFLRPGYSTLGARCVDGLC
mmetsp:Transcript_30149/g.80037  ORF Transcript_30149/g.80037 Transcript_30149/m.80037 type:complete len:252 (+) Transcript_30149:447-1202(+)